MPSTSKYPRYAMLTSDDATTLNVQCVDASTPVDTTLIQKIRHWPETWSSARKNVGVKRLRRQLSNATTQLKLGPGWQGQSYPQEPLTSNQKKTSNRHTPTKNWPRPKLSQLLSLMVLLSPDDWHIVTKSRVCSLGCRKCLTLQHCNRPWVSASDEDRPRKDRDIHSFTDHSVA